MADEENISQDEMDMAAAMEAEAAGSTDEADMAAVMEAMAEQGDGEEIDMEAAMAAMGEGETLSQDEIDSLLGFDSNASAITTGIQALLDRSQENYERLPMLEVVFDRFSRSTSTSLRNLTNENVDVHIDGITSMNFEDYLNSIPLPALISIFQALEWENYGLITIDSSLTYSMVDLLLGGGKFNKPIRIEGRPFTTIEQDIIRNVCNIIMDEMSAAFNPLTPINFRSERLETNPRFATIARPSSPVILIELRVDIDDKGGKVEILMPYATLEPIKDLLVQMFTGESFGNNDTSWETHLTSEIANTSINLQAQLKRKILTLRELSALQVGSTIVMNDKPEDNIALECKGIPMCQGKLGCFNKNLAINITSLFDKNRITDLL